jgi:hypothetical protein
MSSGHQGDNQWEYTECLLGHVVTGVLRLPLLHVATPPFFVLYELLACFRASDLTLTHIYHISAPPSRTVNLGLQG